MFDYDALCNHHSVTGSTVHSLTHTHTHKQTHNPGDIDLECFMMVVLADGWMDGRGQHGHVDTASKSHQRQPCTPSTTVSTIDETCSIREHALWQHSPSSVLAQNYLLDKHMCLCPYLEGVVAVRSRGRKANHGNLANTHYTIRGLRY